MGSRLASGYVGNALTPRRGAGAVTAPVFQSASDYEIQCIRCKRWLIAADLDAALDALFAHIDAEHLAPAEAAQ